MKLEIRGIRSRAKDTVSIAVISSKAKSNDDALVSADIEDDEEEEDLDEPSRNGDYDYGYGGLWRNAGWQCEVFANSVVTVRTRPLASYPMVVFQFDEGTRYGELFHRHVPKPYLFAVAVRGDASVTVSDLRS